MSGLAPRSAPVPSGARRQGVFRELDPGGRARQRREAPFDGAHRGVRDDKGVLHSARWRADRSKLGGGEWVYSNGQPVARTIVDWLDVSATEEFA